MDTDPKKDWKFIALMALIVSVLTFWGTDSKSAHVLAFAAATALITVTLYYTIEMDDILIEFSELSGSAFLKALGLRVLVLLMVTAILATITGHRMVVLLEHVLMVSGQVSMTDAKASTTPGSPAPGGSQPFSVVNNSKTATKSGASKSSGAKSKTSPVVMQNAQASDDGTEGDWDDEEETSPSDVHQSAKSFNSQFLERPSSRITGSTVNSSVGSVSSKPSPTRIAMDGVPTKSSK